MQTFVPEVDFHDSLACLDYKRLGKQRVETLQILKALSGQTAGWVNHPATRMWRGFGPALAEYGLIACDLWIAKGYKDTCRDKIAALRDEFFPGRLIVPDWVDGPIHRTHQSNLVRKLPEFYRPLWPDVPDDLPYHWPG